VIPYHKSPKTPLSYGIGLGKLRQIMLMLQTSQEFTPSLEAEKVDPNR
jgi:hypothetical protein